MANEFVIRIRADDAASATIKKVQAALGKVTEPIEKAQKKVGRLGDAGQVNLARLRKSLGSVGRAAQGVVERIAQIIPGLTALGGAASIASIAALTAKFSAFGFGLNKSSRLLGMNAQDLAAWHVAAKRAGMSAEEFDSSMNSSQMAIRAAAFGADPHAMVVLQKMGVEIKRNNDGSIDYLTTQQRIMKALQAQKSVQGQRDAANTLGMGGLLPMIQQGTWQEDKARAMRKGLIPSDAEIARAKDFRNDVNDLQDSVSGLGNSIGSALIPVLGPVVKAISKWLDQNRAKVAEKIASAVQKFTNWLASVNWGEVTSNVKSLWDTMGGLKGAAVAIAAVTFASPIAGLLSLVTQATRLSGILLPLVANPAVLAVLGATVALRAATDIKSLNEGEDEYLNDGRRAKQGSKWTDPATLDSGEAGAKGRADYIFARLKRAGFTDAQAAGQVGSLLQENSTLDPTKANAASGNSGIAQWGKARKRDFEKTFHKRFEKSNFEDQVNFMLWELKNTETVADKRIRMAKTADQAAEIHAREYERPAAEEANIPRRQALARAVLAEQTTQRRVDVPAQAATGAFNPNEHPAQPQQNASSEPPAEPPKVSDDAAARGERLAQLREQAEHRLHVTFDNVPAGVRPSVKAPDGSHLPTTVNYSLSDMGAMS